MMASWRVLLPLVHLCSERAEAEKAERAARAAAIREQLAELAEELKEKQVSVRHTTAGPLP